MFSRVFSVNAKTGSRLERRKMMQLPLSSDCACSHEVYSQRWMQLTVRELYNSSMNFAFPILGNFECFLQGALYIKTQFGKS